MENHELIHQKIGVLAAYLRDLTTEHTLENAENWREFWALSLDIFEGFKTTYFLTKEEKEAEWQDYNAIKTQANALKQTMDEQLFIDIDANIAVLQQKIAQFGQPKQKQSYQALQAEYEPIMQLAEHTKSLMRGVRFPNRDDREAKYALVQEEQAQLKEYRRIFLDSLSEMVCNGLTQKIKACRFDPKKDTFSTEVNFETLRNASETMKRRQQDLRDVIAEFSAVKSELNAQDKTKIAALLDEIRASHNDFWDAHHRDFESLKQAKDKEYADKHQEYLAKQAAFKLRIAENIKRNQDRLFKATEFRNKQEEQISSLKNKLLDTESGIYADRLNSWLAEAEQKVKEGNEQLERLARFIDEDTAKLQEVNDRQ